MSVRALHTSDWHLGKKLFKQSRLPEQERFLNWLVDYIVHHHLELLLICGDIFDVPNPPNDAVQLYFSFLNKLTELSDCHVIIIPGNHDSSSFISAPTEILKKHNIHIIAGIKDYQENNIISLNINDQSISIKGLPYFRTYELYNEIEKSKKSVEKDDIEKYIKDFFKYWPKESSRTKKIVMGHHAFGSFSATGSEQALMLSGLESIPLNWLGDDFDYMALGHIHKPQVLSNEKNIYYSGSPIPLRFSEKHNKHLNLVTFDPNSVSVEKVEIPVFRDIIQIKSNKEEVYSKIDKSLENLNSDLSPFVEISIQLDEPDNKFNDKVFEYIQDKGAILLSFIPEYSNIEQKEEIDSKILRDHNIQDLFKFYYSQKYPDAQEVPPILMKNFITNLEELNDEDRELED